MTPRTYYTLPDGTQTWPYVILCSFPLGNLLKYLIRFRGKDGLNDLQKALDYARIIHFNTEHRRLKTELKGKPLANVLDLLKRLCNHAETQPERHVLETLATLILTAATSSAPLIQAIQILIQDESQRKTLQETTP